jgi:hypothetical protein
MRTGFRMAGIAFGCGVLLCGTAAADMVSALLSTGVPGYGTAPGVTVASRLRPETEPAGVRAGGFVLRPVLEEAAGYDSAPFGGIAGGSWMLGTRPSLRLDSDWSRHALGAYVAADDRRYLGAPAQSRTDWTLSAGGALDIGRGRLTLSAAHLAQHEDRTQLGALATDRPLAFRLDDARASYALAAGRWTLTPSIQVSSWRYGTATAGGAPLPQAYRDRTLLEGGLTLRYETAPRRDLLLATRVLGQGYAHPQPAQPQRTSTGYQALFGYADGDGVLRYRLLAGLESRHFAAAAYRTHTALIGEAELAWNVTGLTTLTATLTRSMEDAAQEGVSGFTWSAAKLAVDHEYRRDLLLHASAAAQRADFLQGGGQQSGYAAGVGVTWLMRRSVHVSASYDVSALRGAFPAGYTRHLALLTVRLGM